MTDADEGSTVDAWGNPIKGDNEPPPPTAPWVGGQAPMANGFKQEHPSSVTVLVMGILGLILCQILAPIAWIMGSKARREVREQGVYEEGTSLKVGWVLGIVGTILTILTVIIFVAALLIIGVTAKAEVDKKYENCETWSSDTTDAPSMDEDCVISLE